MVDQNSVRRYRKKPVVIEAWRVPNDTNNITAFLEEGIALAEWCGGRSYLMTNDGELAWDNWFNKPLVEGPYLHIDTLEGAHAALPGDWIIKGVAGEFYPCKPDIFEATYEVV